MESIRLSQFTTSLKGYKYNESYILLGIIEYTGPVEYDPKILGHFTAYCRSCSEDWYQYDGTKDQPKSCNIDKAVKPKLVYYFKVQH